MICGQDLSNSGHITGSIDDLFMETLAQKQWNSFPDNSITELPQDVYFRSYVLEANHHVPQHSHSFMQFHFARKGSMRIDVAGIMASGSPIIPNMRSGHWMMCI